MSHISHYKLLQSKLNCLEVELNQAVESDKEITTETEELETKLKDNADDFKQKKTDMEKAYAEELDEYNKQVKYLEELLKKKVEERESQLAYLGELNVCEKSHDELLGFNWSTLRKIANNGDKNEMNEFQYHKSVETSALVEVAQTALESIFVLADSTKDARSTVLARILEIREYIGRWKKVASNQQRTIMSLESENYRLNLIIKQCISNDEPMSENITRNVRDRCLSFINSTSVEDLIQGLKKYHQRQDNKIKLLKRKVNKLSHELSHLQVANDQTSDLIHHYLTMIHANSNRLLAYNPSRVPPPEEV